MGFISCERHFFMVCACDLLATDLGDFRDVNHERKRDLCRLLSLAKKIL